ncbi:Glycoside hydrolase, 38 vacuolar alpha mannosidase [Tulasnella sp. 418]|nr:Glycoside hydrolase, 38 vacuolar alpha mannosidase [Tulasnella sp. 418]
MGGRQVGEQSNARNNYPELNFGSGPKWLKNITSDRLGRFSGGHYADVNLSAVLFYDRIDDKDHIQMKVWDAPGRSKPTFDEVMKVPEKEWRVAKKGDWFGPSCEFLLSELVEFTLIQFAAFFWT